MVDYGVGEHEGVKETSEDVVRVIQARRAVATGRSAGVGPYLGDRMDRSWCGRVGGEKKIRNDALFSLCSNWKSVGAINSDRK